jgi:hypothetical protein
VSQLPDRSLFVHARDPNQPSSGPNITVGDITITSDQKEQYATDSQNVVNLNVHHDTEASPPGPQWQVLTLRRAGTEQRQRCNSAHCDRFVTVEEILSCAECGAATCSRHVDREFPDCCVACAEKLRAREFQEKSNRMTTKTSNTNSVDAFAGVVQSAAAFEGRIWTEVGATPTTRDICTVPRNSRDCHQIGQEFTLNVQADQDCYLTLLDIGTSGNVALLLQNYRLHAGKPVQLSGPDAGHMWVVGGPPGVEQIKAIFTLQPVALFPGTPDFSLLAAAGRTRDLVTKARDAESTLSQLPPDSWTDALCQFVVE